jgi:hypothetical protein
MKQGSSKRAGRGVGHRRRCECLRTRGDSASSPLSTSSSALPGRLRPGGRSRLAVLVAMLLLVHLLQRRHGFAALRPDRPACEHRRLGEHRQRTVLGDGACLRWASVMVGALAFGRTGAASSGGLRPCRMAPVRVLERWMPSGNLVPCPSNEQRGGSYEGHCSSCLPTRRR